MLKFTANQASAILAVREKFNDDATGYNDPEGLVGNSLGIPLDAWKRIDARATQIARTRLVVFDRLAAANTQPVGLGDVVNYYPQVSDSGEVQEAMDFQNLGKNDPAEMRFVGTPQPVLFARFGFDYRRYAVMTKGGTSGQNIELATFANHQRKMAEKLEDIAINGASSVVDGKRAYGMRNYPDRNTNTHGLTLASASGAQWLGVMKDIIAKAQADNQFQPVTVFVNLGDYTYIESTDYTANYPKTILSRLRELSQIREIVPAASIPANEVIGIAGLDAGGEWGQVNSAMPITTRPRARLNMTDAYEFDVMASAVVQWRSDYEGRCALVHLTAS